MVKIIIHIAYITRLVTNDAWHGWGPYHLAELAILWLASMVMDEVRAHNPGKGHAPWPRGQDYTQILGRGP